MNASPYQGYNQPNGNQTTPSDGNKGEENFFLNGAQKVKNGAETIAQTQENVPVVGGLMADATRLGAEVATLPTTVTGYTAIGTGSLIEASGKGQQMVAGFVENGFDKVGNLYDKGANTITGVADNIAQVEEQIPIVGGLLADSTRLGGEALALPGKAAGALTHLTGDIVSLPGKIVGGVTEAIGGFVKKL